LIVPHPLFQFHHPNNKGFRPSKPEAFFFLQAYSNRFMRSAQVVLRSSPCGIREAATAFSVFRQQYRQNRQDIDR
jgi:hypothetical protein